MTSASPVLRETPHWVNLLRAAILTVAAALIFVFVSLSAALAQQTLVPDVRDALSRINTSKFSHADQALLFANNDAINAARLNNEISDAYYQAAQGDYDRVSQNIAAAAAEEAGAKFDVQIRTSPEYSPGTDSDYITEVRSKAQIEQMQESYNRRVNDFLKDGLEDKAPPRSSTWHNKLDVDFMADPEYIRDPAEFRRIAEVNNDAYKSRFAAQYEKISRQKGGGKIGPQHVNGYMSEMERFASKKRGKIEELLKKPPSHFNNPANRAELYRIMAQEQKYVSRLESLDDYLRAQEGLPPRNRGVTSSKLGSNRSPGNAANTRAGSALAEAARADALEDLADTMAQVSRNNPGFDRHAADSIASVIEKLPPNRRVAALARIQASGRPGLVDQIVDASRRAGRMPPGSSLLDDAARAGSKLDDANDLARKLDALKDAGGGRRAIRPAIGLLDAIGRAANAAEMVAVTSQLAGLLAELDQALDPATPPDVAQQLLEDIRLRAGELRDSAILGAIMERFPIVAGIYGGLFVGCLTGELISPGVAAGELGEGTAATGSCLDRHVAAMDRFSDWLTGEEEAREQNREQLCEKFRDAVKQGRARMKDDWTVLEACQFIRYGNTINHMFDRVDPNAPPADVAEGREEEIAPDAAAETVRAQIDNLFAAIEAIIASGEADQQEITAICTPLMEAPILTSSGRESDGDVAGIHSDLDAAISAARQAQSRIEQGGEIADVLLAAVSRSAMRAREESDNACRLAGAPEPQLEDIKNAALNARNHAVLASQVGQESIKRIDASQAGLESELPDPADFVRRAAPPESDGLAICEMAAGIAGDRFMVNPLPGAVKKATSQLAVAFGLLRHDNLPDKVDYTLRYASFQQRTEALAASGVDFEACAARFLEISAQCTGANGAQGRDLQAKLDAYAAAHGAAQTAKAAATERHAAATATLQQAMQDAADAADRARLCFENAENGISDPDATLNELADLSGLSCSTAATRERISAIREAGLEKDPRGDGLVARLETIRDRVKTANQTLGTVNEQISSARRSEELEGISQLVSTVRRALADVPGEIDCGWLHESLAEASRWSAQQAEQLDRKNETYEEAEQRCMRKYGARFSRVGGSTGSYSCRYCEEGRLPKNGKCYRPETLAQQWCNDNNPGSGYEAFDFKPNGKYSCRLTEEAANRWCNDNNKGAGWTAHLRSNGTYDCRQDPRTARREAVQYCKGVARSQGKVYATTEFSRDGSYRCRWCERGFYYSKGRCHARQQQVRKPAPRQQAERCYLPPPCHVDLSMTQAGQVRERQCRAEYNRLMIRYNQCKARGGR